MLKIQALDSSYQVLEKDLAPFANWLIAKLAKGEIETKKQLKKGADFYLELYLVNDKTLAKNVYAYEFPENFPNPESNNIPLGEIYINPKIAEKQGYSASYMLVHGFLHLLGYEHQAKNDTIAMEALEKDLLDQFSVA